MNKNLIQFISLAILAFLASCGSEQFGTTPQNKSQQVDGLTAFKQGSCSNHTLVKPAVDVVYFVDNSSSTFYLADDIKNAIKSTVSSISSQFDYRIIGTPLLSDDHQDFQVLAKDSGSLNSSFNVHKVNSPNDFNFFSNINPGAGANEPGTKRVRDFLTAHQSDGLLRQDSYLFIVLVSNGRDTDLEVPSYPGSPETIQNTVAYNTRLQELKTVKSYFNSQQFRFFSLTPLTNCQSGWKSSKKSYAQMSKDLYLSHTNPPLTDQGSKQYPDNYDLCNSVSSVFRSVNNTIKQIIVPHKYKYWAITFTDGENMDVSKIKVLKSANTNATPVEMTSGWSYKSNPSRTNINTRIEPTPGEPTTARHMIEFAAGSEIVYPACVTVTSSTNLEYYQYIVLDRPAKVDSITVKINGKDINPSTTNGWSYGGYQQVANIKVQHNGYSDLPAVPRSGYMIKLNGSVNYYKSGDNVEVYYLPDSL